jgi:hypothetical protein
LLLQAPSFCFHRDALIQIDNHAYMPINVHHGRSRCAQPLG